MAQFVLYKNQDKQTRKTYPYFVDVQNALFSDLNSRVVIPFVNLDSFKKADAERLCPLILIQNKKYVMLTHQITTVPASILEVGETSLEDFRYQILDAIDMLITGI